MNDRQTNPYQAPETEPESQPIAQPEHLEPLDRITLAVLSLCYAVPFIIATIVLTNLEKNYEEAVERYKALIYGSCTLFPFPFGSAFLGWRLTSRWFDYGLIYLAFFSVCFITPVLLENEISLTLIMQLILWQSLAAAIVFGTIYYCRSSFNRNLKPQ